MTGMNLNDEPVRCFLDGVDWQHHLDADAYGTKLYPSRKALEGDNEHNMEQCGIVEVEVRLVRWVVKQDFHKCEREHGGHDWQPASDKWRKLTLNEECSRCGCGRYVEGAKK